MTTLEVDLTGLDPEVPWPQRVNEVLVEPASGMVRVRRPHREPLTLDPVDARALAAAAPSDWLRELLDAAATEAERQENALTEVREAWAY